VYSGRREAGLVMTSPFHNPVREGLPTIHELARFVVARALTVLKHKLVLSEFEEESWARAVSCSSIAGMSRRL
jgi:hypothetical protein